MWTLLLCAARAQDLPTLGEGKPAGVSGLAVRGADGGVITVVVVNDTKRTETWAPVYRITLRGDGLEAVELAWQGERPHDLEAVSNIPGAEADVLAVQSDGLAIRVTLGPDSARPGQHWMLPDADQLEGALVLDSAGGALTVLYGNRGALGEAGVVRVATLGADGAVQGVAEVGAFTSHLRGKRRAPDQLRHISDLAIDGSGMLWATAAVDPGDDGPFKSEIYALGAWDAAQRRIVPAATPAPRCPTGIKLEGLAFASEALVLGSDDENKGGRVAVRQAGSLKACR